METSDNLKHKVFTEGKAAPSFTSTSLDPTTKNKFRAMTQKEVYIYIYIHIYIYIYIKCIYIGKGHLL